MKKVTILIVMLACVLAVILIYLALTAESQPSATEYEFLPGPEVVATLDDTGLELTFLTTGYYDISFSDSDLAHWGMSIDITEPGTTIFYDSDTIRESWWTDGEYLRIENKDTGAWEVHYVN